MGREGESSTHLQLPVSSPCHVMLTSSITLEWENKQWMATPVKLFSYVGWEWHLCTFPKTWIKAMTFSWCETNLLCSELWSLQSSQAFYCPHVYVYDWIWGWIWSSMLGRLTYILAFWKPPAAGTYSQRSVSSCSDLWDFVYLFECKYICKTSKE